jgi:hypothetical protein
MLDISSVTPTISLLSGVPTPKTCNAKTISEVVNVIKTDAIIKKLLLYLPDAVGETIYKDYSSNFQPVKQIAPINVKMRSIYPTYTPVCFASMFTGAHPDTHGISKYEKPVIKIDTLFDSFIKVGRRVAIVAVKDSSMDIIFRNRTIDYFSEEYDPEVEKRAIELIREDHHDLIVVYHQEYDDTMHRTTPRSPDALKAFRKHIQSFKRLGNAFIDQNNNIPRLVAFLPDDGVHLDPITGKGTHGTDEKEDIEVRHFWGIYRR